MSKDSDSLCSLSSAATLVSTWEVIDAMAVDNFTNEVIETGTLKELVKGLLENAWEDPRGLCVSLRAMRAGEPLVGMLCTTLKTEPHKGVVSLIALDGSRASWEVEYVFQSDKVFGNVRRRYVRTEIAAISYTGFKDAFTEKLDCPGKVY